LFAAPDFLEDMTRDALVAEQVKALAGRVAAGLGLEVFDVQYRREAAGMVLRVQIDRPGPAASAEESVSVEDCARVSRDLSALLDVEDIVPAAYTLEVSSPGLDRPLRGAADYARFTGRRAKVVVRSPIDGQGFFKGRLAAVAAGQVTIETDDGRPHVVPIEQITRANLEVDF
jgi:ribosome maturation factor RimP